MAVQFQHWTKFAPLTHLKLVPAFKLKNDVHTAQ